VSLRRVPNVQHQDTTHQNHLTLDHNEQASHLQSNKKTTKNRKNLAKVPDALLVELHRAPSSSNHQGNIWKHC